MPSLFISYAHVDMDPIHWLNRLTLYLAPLREHGDVEIWDDSKIQAGDQWRTEIDRALQRATAAILLVGPGFLASDFIAREELPRLLDAANKGGTRIYPLVVGYCGYRGSRLDPFQAFNDPDIPLEALERPDQNKWLNDLSRKVDADIRVKKIEAAPPAEKRSQITAAIKQEKVEEVTNVNFNLSIGTAVPAGVRYHAIPSRIVEIYPEWRGYEFILVHGRYVILRPHTHEIVYIIEG